MINTIITGAGMEHATYTTLPALSGTMVWDGSINAVKIVDHTGVVSTNYTTSQMVQLDADTRAAIAWVKEKMVEEAKLTELCNNHPGLKDAKEKFDILLALVRAGQ